MTTPNLPFEAIGVQDFLVHPIEKGVEYMVLEVSPDGARFQAQLQNGTLAWFPTKFVRILDNQSQRGGQQQRVQQQQQQQQQQRSPQQQQYTEEEMRRREYEAAKRDAQDKERRRLELQTKARQQPQRAAPAQDEDWLSDMMEDVSIKPAAPQKPKMGTYTETRGYLANAPGFGKNLDAYADDEPEIEPSPDPLPVITQTKNPRQEQKYGVYRTVEDPPDGPKYVQSSDIPDQYKNTLWKCHSCSSTNPPDKSKCSMCGTQRGVQSTYVQGSSNSPQQEWTCSSCKVSNQSNRENCVMCGTKYKPPAPSPSKNPGAVADKKKKAPGPAGAGPKKKAIVTKAGAGIELQYAKGVDIFNYKSGSTSIPGHGAGY